MQLHKFANFYTFFSTPTTAEKYTIYYNITKKRKPIHFILNNVSTVYLGAVSCNKKITSRKSEFDVRYEKSFIQHPDHLIEGFFYNLQG